MNQQLLLLTRQSFDRHFTFQSQTSTALRFLVDQGNGQTAACVTRCSPGVVLLASSDQVVGDPGVERVVRAPQNVNEPFSHLFQQSSAETLGIGSPISFLAHRCTWHVEHEDYLLEACGRRC